MSSAEPMDPAAEILSRCREILEDLEFGEVAAWKERNPGGKAIGYLPVYVPRPLLESIGCLPVAVFGGGDQVEIIRGDSYFQSYICHLPRSVVELALRGCLDVLDGMLFPSTCDVVRNLGGVFKLLFEDRYAAYVDLPQNFDPALGGRFFADEMRRIATGLEAIGARPLDDDALAAAIGEENTRRSTLRELGELRRAEPWRVLASEAYLVVRVGSMMTAADHEELLQRFLEALRARQPRVYDNVRVVVEGSFCEQPPLGLILSLERAGCYIVDDDFQLGMRTIEGEIEIGPEENPVTALARAFVQQGSASSTRYIAEHEKGAALVERVKRAEADGVIFSSASFCDPALLDRPMLEVALDRAGIPHTSFKFAENTGQFQVIREQAGAFSDSVKLWGGAT